MMVYDFGRIPIYALDISDQSFKFLRLLDTSKGIVVQDFGEGVIDSGVLENGEIKDKNRFSEILKEIFQENHIKFVALSLPEEKGFLREIKISGVSEKELPSVLEFQIEEHVPLPSAEVLFNYTIANIGNNYFDLIVSAFPKNFVESYLESITSSGALPVIVESELESTARSVMPKDFLKTAMIVDWGKTRVSFSVFENGILRFAFTSPMGGNVLNDSISKNFGIGKKEAIKLKLKTDLMNLQNSPKILNAITPVLSSFADEIKKNLNYWRDRSGSKNVIEQIFLSGGDSNLFGLSEYLRRELDLSVSLANPWVNVDFPSKYLPSIKFKDSLRFSCAIGLSLRALKEEKIA